MDDELAATIAENVCGERPVSLRRFTTGSRHFVYEATFAGRAPVVVRVGDASAHDEMAGAVHLSKLLRPLGVPLPRLLAEDIAAPLPCIVLERLPGSDLWDSIRTLPDDVLSGIANAVAKAQALVATTPSAGRFGYAAHPAQAPHAAWRQVLEDNLARSRRRIMAAGLFDAGLVERVQALLDARADRLAAIAATPFLHDTTTKNVIVTPAGEFSGIVDVDDLCFGDPRYATALTLAVLQAHGGPTRYVDYWLKAAGQPDDDLFRLYVALFLLDLMGEHGQVFNGNQQPSQPEARAKLLAAFETALLEHE
jgi:aminoglycoside phosphotransferase (APT) family kinase protein